jgi:hypothetical protein
MCSPHFRPPESESLWLEISTLPLHLLVQLVALLQLSSCQPC